LLVINLSNTFYRIGILSATSILFCFLKFPLQSFRCSFFMVKEQFGKGKAACWVFPCALMTLRKPFSNCHPSTWSALENPESNERNSRKYKRKKWGSSVPLSLFIMLLKSFITQAFLSFICCLLCQKKKIRKVTRKRGRISYQPHRGCCHIPSLLIYSYSVAHLLRHFSLYPYKGLQKKNGRKRKCGAQVWTLNTRIIPIIIEFEVHFEHRKNCFENGNEPNSTYKFLWLIYNIHYGKHIFSKIKECCVFDFTPIEIVKLNHL